jgi:hypothetical protein
VEQGKADKEIVILDVEDMSSSDQSDWWRRCPVCAAVFTNREEGTDHMYQPCDPPDPNDLGDGFLCETCNTVFDTEESRDYHELCPEDPRNETTRVSGSTEGAIPKERTTIAANTRPKTAFTKARVVSTVTDYGRAGTTKRKDGHNYTSPQRQVNRDSEESSTGHYSDPTEFSEDDDDSNPKCSPLRCTVPHSESSNDVVELDTSSESSNNVAGLDTDSVSSNKAVELEQEEPAMNFGFSTRERRDRLLGRAAD